MCHGNEAAIQGSRHVIPDVIKAPIIKSLIAFSLHFRKTFSSSRVNLTLLDLSFTSSSANASPIALTDHRPHQNIEVILARFHARFVLGWQLVLGLHIFENERLAFQEDDIHELADDEKEKLTELDTLTGIPLPNDILLYAVPVCGPYNALQSYKFHVKITPGTAKKGKAAKTAINLFTHMQDATTREKELMKALNEPELVAAMIGNAKIAAPGLTQLKQRQKKGKKASQI